jgi:UDP-GlcNAc:undecaprenyl-phosphate GlcNAc-1-phosphate transferase
MNSFFLLFCFFASFLTSLYATPLILRLAKNLNAVDHPDQRKIHSRLVPRLGGVAIYIGFSLHWLILSLLHYPVYFGTGNQYLVLIGATFMLLLGIMDDLRGLNAWQKLPVQIAVALLVGLGGYHIRLLSLPWGGAVDLGRFGIILSVLWIVGLSNAMNLIDGLDGLAAGISTIGAVTIFAVALILGHSAAALSALLLAGGILGFLRYNFYPAKIFMGDSGSLFLGFTLAVLSLESSEKSTLAIPLLIPIVALGLPIADTLFSVVRRFIKGTSIFSADREHFHHKLILKGFSHPQAVLLLYGISAILGGASVLMTMIGHRFSFYVLPILGFGFIGGLRFLGYAELSQVTTLLTAKPLVIRAPGCKRLLLEELTAALREKRGPDQIKEALETVGVLLELDRVSLRFFAGNNSSVHRYHYEWIHPRSGEAPSLWSVTIPLKKAAEYVGNLTFTKDHSVGCHYTPEDLALASYTGECIGQWVLSNLIHDPLLSRGLSDSHSLPATRVSSSTMRFR